MYVQYFAYTVSERCWGHHCSPLPQVSNLIPELMGTVDTDKVEKVGITP